MKSIQVHLDNIFLDPNNFRLHGHAKYKKVELSNTMNVMVQNRTLDMITEGERNEGIKDLLDSVKSNGFLKIDNVLVKKIDDSNYVVIEGNRRIATLKTLVRDFEKGYDVGNVSQDLLTNKLVDVVEYDVGEDESESYLLLMGLRHVTKVKDWGDFEQSELVHDLHVDHGLTFSDISEKLGIHLVQVKRRINTFVAMQIYKKDEDYGTSFSSNQSTIFFELMGAPAIRDEWLGWSEESKTFDNKVKLKRFFSWVSKYEDVSEPIIKTRDDIRLLKKIIFDDEALDIMEESGSILEAYEQSLSVTAEGVKKAIAALKGNADKITISAVRNLGEKEKTKLLSVIDTLKDIEKLL
ncbi:ParB N-terminal domain-containing protein [Aeromonas veronii]|uniref:ParB N-terminal domain-containing protein n=1 Tax=Aeromonas veronii TaxID=654 RepID=UPI003D25E663